MSGLTEFTLTLAAAECPEGVIHVGSGLSALGGIADLNS
jgi:hypothetical protein